MTQYEVECNNDKVIVSYSRGKLKRIEVKKGTLDLEELATIVPEKESHIPEKWFKKIEQKPKDGFFKPAQKAWMEFYHSQTGLDYRFMGADGKALKDIGQYLKGLTGSEDEALDAWKFILHRWNRLEDFYQRNMDLRFVNSQLNKIVNQLKNGTNTGKTAARNTADDLRRRFAD
ncbi:hypothetical protein ACT29H_01785 [Thermophagus sp. OGC60D27]|uniref:hypothetical protein n=1 Tax=Thermophagus sp. OGC60D27 TaxID=3458415 RepID=UPI004037BD3F